MLEQVNFDEARQSQLPFIELLINMGYTYIPVQEALKERGNDTSNFLLHDIAAKKLMELNGFEIDGIQYKFSERDVRDTIDELENIQYEGLIDTAQKIYNIVMPTSGGKTIRINHKGKASSQNFRFIDFEHPENNAFHVTAEYEVSGKQNIRPDIVCLVNGIPFAVIENKKSSVSVMEAINQMNRNQGQEYCPKFYSFAQLLVATNGKELQYGTTGTLSKFYAIWKEKGTSKQQINKLAKQYIGKPIALETYAKVLNDLNATTTHKQRLDRLPTEQDRSVVTLFNPSRLLDLAKNYILFDAGVKKLSRYQQYFAIQRMLERIEKTETSQTGVTRRKGGLLWHTQGSGKSLTMVMFVKALIEDPNIKKPRVIIVTDRKDLDRQIKGTFNNCNLKKKVIQATSGQNLINFIKEKNLAVITTLVHKFESASKKRQNFVDTDMNIFVLVDEAHRTQSGVANLQMNRIIPNACYIGFTGTPLMTKEKESWRKFGSYIDKYTIDDALEDKIILPLIYEGRYVNLLQNEEQMDKHADRVTEDLTPKYKVKLQKEVKVKMLSSNPQRIEEIAHDIEEHYVEKFKGTGLKAQIVAPSKYAATVFQKYFERRDKVNTAIVISDEHEDGALDNTRKSKVINYLNEIRRKHSSVANFEKEVIESFKHNDDGIEIIMVVDKLLTGFDAPRNTVLYLAKDLRDHGLLQAIARVNRLYENKKLPKTAGYIVDYSENAKNIKTAMQLFGNYDEDDVHGTLIDVTDKINELEGKYDKLFDIFKAIKHTDDDEEYLELLKDKQKRDLFYKYLNEFNQSLSECFVLQDFIHGFKKLDIYRRDLKKFAELRKSTSLKYADSIDLTEYRNSLVKILDKYVDAGEVELLTTQVSITDKKYFDEVLQALGSDKSKAEAIAHQTEKTITEKYREADPELFKRFSQKVKSVIERMHAGKLEDIEALKQMKLIRDEVLDRKDETLPEKVERNNGAAVFYRNLRSNFDGIELSQEQYEDIVIDIFEIIKKRAIIDWEKNSDVKRLIANDIDDYLYDVVRLEKGLEITAITMKKIIVNSLKLAENNVEVFDK